MNIKTKLGGLAVLLFMGIFYIFAFSMVDSVEDMSMPTEYYYSIEPDMTEPTEDDNVPEVKTEKPKKTTEKKAENAQSEDNPGADAENNEVVPAMVDLNEAAEKNSSDNSAAVTEKASDNSPVEDDDDSDDDYPEDFDVDDYDDDDNEAEEQSGHARDNDDEFLVSDDDDEPFEEDIAQTETPFFTETNNDQTTDPFAGFVPDTPQPPAEEAKVSVNAEAADSANVTANETFTVKFNGTVQTMNAYDLICWIVNNEMSSSFNDEAIKAQAVAAYSYVKYHNVNGLTPSVLVKKEAPKRIRELVASVWGVCCYYNGSVAQTVYMASSSGYTADARNVWGGSVPYLKSVHCPLDAQYDPNYGSTMTVSESSMRSILEGYFDITLSDNPYNWLTITGHVDGNYVSEISIDGKKTVSGRKMRENVMSYKLKSAAFDVSYNGSEFVFTTYGYGHGVGMSQNGANILANQGYTYTQILKFYFTGIEVL